MTAIDNSRIESTMDVSAESSSVDAWELLRDLISPRHPLHLPETEH